jgi:RNA polymerase sigma-70 factor (ECF subfamily)
MLSLARAITRSHSDAEDCVQQTFLELFKARRGFARAASLRAYAMSALRHTALRLRERRREEPWPGAGEEPALTVEGSANPKAEELERALWRLPEEQREVIALKIDADLTFAEIGQALAISPNTAASRYRYALERLAQILGSRP